MIIYIISNMSTRFNITEGNLTIPLVINYFSNDLILTANHVKQNFKSNNFGLLGISSGVYLAFSIVSQQSIHDSDYWIISFN